MELAAANSEWEIIDLHSERSDKFYPCCIEPYPDITVTVTVKRISPSYKALIITPAFGKI